tara:strand:+ start:253 stop:849 length:597 start_codon:yes stop_codon:yes gene_type:complete
MGTNKASIYDGSVFLNSVRDTLDLTNWINRRTTQLFTRGVTSITLNVAVTNVVKVGDKLIKSATNELIGTVSEVDGANVLFSQPTKVNLAQNDYVHVYPKFEIVKIEFLQGLTYLLNLTPSDTRHVGSEAPDLNVYSSNADEDFGAHPSNKGVIMYDGAFLPGKSIEGRFKRVTIDSTDPSVQDESVICYLRATPTIM